jgi:hypothetical protein
MPPSHRNGDSRTCGASTVVSGQSTTYVDGKLWSVEGDPNSHGAGNLIATGSTVFIQGRKVIVHTPDNAQPDSLCPVANAQHCTPKTAGGSGKTYAYGG